MRSRALRRHLEDIWHDRQVRAPLHWVWWRYDTTDKAFGHAYRLPKEIFMPGKLTGIWWSHGKLTRPRTKAQVENSRQHVPPGPWAEPIEHVWDWRRQREMRR